MANIDSNSVKSQLIRSFSDPSLRKEIYVPCSLCLKEGTDSQFELSLDSRMIVCFACGSYITFEDFIDSEYKIQTIFFHEDLRVKIILDDSEQFGKQKEQRQRIKKLEEEERAKQQEYWINHMRYNYFSERTKNLLSIIKIDGF